MNFFLYFARPPPPRNNFSNGPSVTPLFKQVEASDLNDYRPISVISIIAKVFERIVYDQSYNFLSDEDIILHINRAFAPYTQL